MWRGRCPFRRPPGPQHAWVLTCFPKREVIFGVVHSQDRVVIGGRHSALGWRTLVKGTVLRFPGEKAKTDGLVYPAHCPRHAAAEKPHTMIFPLKPQPHLNRRTLFPRVKLKLNGNKQDAKQASKHPMPTSSSAGPAVLGDGMGSTSGRFPGGCSPPGPVLSDGSSPVSSLPGPPLATQRACPQWGEEEENSRLLHKESKVSSQAAETGQKPV